MKQAQKTKQRRSFGNTKGSGTNGELIASDIIRRCNNRHPDIEIKKVHGDRTLEIYCKSHGENTIKYKNFMKALLGCPQCGLATRFDKVRGHIPDSEILKRCRSIHNDEYIYSQLNPNWRKEKSKIIHKKCGREFEQLLQRHVKGRMCTWCAQEANGNKLRKTIETFIYEANLIHNCKYGYSNAVYINSTTPLEVLCHEHGTFWIMPSHHLEGQGCKLCRKYYKRSSPSVHILNEHIGILYLIEAQTETETFLKIGISKFTNCNKRLNNIKKDFRHANKGMDIQLK